MTRERESESRSTRGRPDSRTAALAQAVRRRREELKLRQAELADLAGCSLRFVHTVENGKATLRLDKVLDVLEVLGLNLVVASGWGRVVVAPDAGPERSKDT